MNKITLDLNHYTRRLKSIKTNTHFTHCPECGSEKTVPVKTHYAGFLGIILLATGACLFTHLFSSLFFLLTGFSALLYFLLSRHFFFCLECQKVWKELPQIEKSNSKIIPFH